MATITPFLLIQRHLETILHHLPGTFDGDVESVHQARVAARRLREVLPYLPASGPGHPSGAADAIRSAGRYLGRVRDLDVMSGLLDRAGQRMPSTAAAVAAAKASLAARRWTWGACPTPSPRGTGRRVACSPVQRG
jgi:CHAD domain-containing protein